MSNFAMMTELFAGVLVYALTGEIIILIFAGNKLYESVGFIAGALLAAVMIFHMALSVEEAVSMGEEGALKHIRKTYIFRFAAVLAVFLLLFFLHLGDVVAALFGLLSLKVSAYLQPITHKVAQKITNKGR